MMLRPRESRELRLMRFALSVKPSATLRWTHDIFGNAIATAQVEEMSDQLIIHASMKLDVNSAAWPVFDIAASALEYPFLYSEAEWLDLGALTQQQYADPEGRLAAWAAAFKIAERTDTLAFLKDLSLGVEAAVTYQVREEEGTQSPLETLDRGIGSCRDMAVLFAEAARSLGLGARIVSGYLFRRGLDPALITDAGSTHAWAEIFIPGAGWVTFDPTNRSVGNFNLVPVAVARTIEQIMPVTGSFVGATNAFRSMNVEVSVVE